MATEASDLELINETLGGHNRSFGTLVERYSALCYRIFLQLGINNSEVIRDLMQDSFIKAYQNLSRFDRQRSFRPWLLTICRNVGFNHYRRQTLERNASTLLHRQPSHDPQDQAVQRTVVDAALERLESVPREIVAYKYFLDLTCQEIAEIVDLPEGTVKSHLYHARMRLLEILAEDPR
jgi:RNA polymerase sigma-70 factor, ECF subfamily